MGASLLALAKSIYYLINSPHKMHKKQLANTIGTGTDNDEHAVDKKTLANVFHLCGLLEAFS